MRTEINLVLEKYRRFNDHNLARLVRTVERHVTNEISRTLQERGYKTLSARHLQVFENLDTEGVSIVSLAQRAGISKKMWLDRDIQGRRHCQLGSTGRHLEASDEQNGERSCR